MSKLKGFTLLELLIAISIFSIMAALAYGGLQLMLDGSQRLEQSANELTAMQRAFLFMQQDIEQLTTRSIRDEFGSQEEALSGGNDDELLYLTRGGVNGVIRGGSDLRRVEYQLSEGSLKRRVWSVLDRVQGSEYSLLHLMSDVQGVELRFMGYDKSDDWHNYWPPESKTGVNMLPKAVEVTIKTKKFGAVSRLFVVGL